MRELRCLAVLIVETAERLCRPLHGDAGESAIVAAIGQIPHPVGEWNVYKREGVNRETREFARLREARGLNPSWLGAVPGRVRFKLENRAKT
jgi:hypothetical protein